MTTDGPTTEQDDLRAAVRSFLGKHAAPLRSREPGAFDAPLWTRMTAELGLTAMAVPAEHGGLGASPVELAIVLEEAGRVLLAAPLLSTVVAAAFAPPEELASLAAGTTLATVAPDGTGVSARADGAGHRLDGVLAAVPDGDVADLALVGATLDGGPAMFAVRLGGVDRTPMSTLDQTRPVARIALRGAPAQRLPSSPAQVLDAWHLAAAVESVGAAAANLELTLAYLQTRRQFGQALAGFQALRHRVADLYAGLEAARSSVWYALRAPAEEQPLAAPIAALVAAQAAYAIAAEGIQLHGGIGFTWEHDAQRFLKRATVGRLAGGGPVALRRLIGARAGFAP